jgi:hypothetical protein
MVGEEEKAININQVSAVIDPPALAISCQTDYILLMPSPFCGYMSNQDIIN